MSVDSQDDGVGGDVLDAAIDVDDDEYVRRRRLKAINDARERAAEMPAKTWPLVVEGRLGRETRELMIFSAVQAFIREVWPALEAVDNSTELLKDATLGEIELTPPGNRRVANADATTLVELDNNLASFEVADARQYSAIRPTGLEFVIDSPGRFRTTWRALKENHTRADETEVVRGEQTIPERISMAAFDLAIDGLRDTDLSISAQRDRDEYDQSYGHLAATGVDETTNGHH
jgi:hypothetical protein